MKISLGSTRVLLLVAILASSVVFALFRGVLDGFVGFSYGDSTAVARVVHDVAMMLWGVLIASLYGRLISKQSK